MALDESENGVVTVGNNMKVGNNTVTNQQEQEINNRSGHQQQTTEKTLQTATNGLAANKKMQQTKSGKQATDANISFLRAARSGDKEKVIEFLESGQVADINTCNANGLNALHLAAKDGYVDIVHELLKRGAAVDNATKKGNTALHIASLAGQKEVIKLLLQYNANVNVQSLTGFSPLYMAAQENHDACVKYLLAKGANPSLATEDGFTPLAVAMQQGHDKVVAVLLESDSRGKVRLPALHIAAKKDDVKAATLLLENEHNPDVASKSGFTPLHIAAHYGNVDVANLLIEKGADVNYTAKHNITPIHVACKWGKSNMLNLLLLKGAKIDCTTRDGLTPLHCAARSGHERVIEILLKHNAPILSKTKNGLAPLHMAAQGEHDEAARILLLHNAPVDDVTVDYLTALHVAAHCGHVKVAKLLLDYNADPNSRALNGFTPLHIACKKNRIKVVELLLKNNANISATTESGLTPLHVASFMGCMNIVIYLLQHDANPDAPTVRGETPLHLAARANQTDIIRILLRNQAQVDIKAREGQTPLHVASRLGNTDIVMLLLQHGANVDSVTNDLYTPLHIAAKEGQEEIAAVLIEHDASLDATTKKGFTPLHLGAKYGHINIVQHLLQKGAAIDVQGKNSVTPLHVACHYNHQNVALLLLDKGASPHISAKNGHTALHIAAKKDQMDIATHLLQYGAKPDVESKSGFTPLHLAAQEGHVDMVKLLLEHGADSNKAAKNGLTPMHLCAQEDKTDVARVILDHNGKIDERTKAGYTPLHVAAHFGQVNMVKFLLENDANIELSTNVGYTPLHQAAQQGHTLIINLLLTHRANPNALTNTGHTALSIANKLGYVTAVETLKVVTETSISNTVTGVLEEKYKVCAPESMHEAFMSDSEDEAIIEDNADQHQYKYMATDDLKNTSYNMKYDTTDEGICEQKNVSCNESSVAGNYVNADVSNPYIIKSIDNVNIVRQPINVGWGGDPLEGFEIYLQNLNGRIKIHPMCRESFLVSFLVDARGGAMRGCRHSGVRVIVPPKAAPQPTRITCRYVKAQRIPNPPPLMEGEALVSRVLELSPVEAKFLGPVILEVPHFGSLRQKEREIIILRSDNGQTWREHTLQDSDEAVCDVLNETFESNELNQLEDLHTNRIIRIVTHDFPHFFAVVSRIRQEVHAIGPDGGTVSSTAVPQVQAIFPPNALTKKIRVGLQAQPVDPVNCAKLLGQGVAVSPVVTVEPRRRKFHKAITLSMPAPRAHTQGMVNQYSGSAPTLRLLCSITGGQNRAIWEDVTGSTPLTFVKDSVSFTTTVSARFWLMDCRNISEACRMATELYSFMAKVPFMVKFVVFAKRISAAEAKLSVFCMTDDKEDKTLEQQEFFTEVAKSRDVEVLEGQSIYLEFIGNLSPIMKSGEQLTMQFNAFRENRLSFTVRIKDQEDPFGRISFMNDPKIAKGDPPQTPICTLNVSLKEEKIVEESRRDLNSSQRSLDQNYRVTLNGGLGRLGINTSENEIRKADIRLSDICNLLSDDWEELAHVLGVPDADIELIKAEYPDRPSQRAMVMLRLWMSQAGPKQATGNTLEQALHKIKRSDIVDKCVFNLELVTDEMEKAVAKMQLDQSGFDNLKEELDLGPGSRDTSLRRNKHLNSNNVTEKSDEKPEFNGKKDDTVEQNEERNDNEIDKELLKRTLNISADRATGGGGDGTSTPPPTPVDAAALGNWHAEKKRIPPTAQPETTDFSQQEGADKKVKSESKPIIDAPSKITEEDAIATAEILADQILKDLEESTKNDDVEHSEQVDKEPSRIPVPTKASTPIKVKTIKKHSKTAVVMATNMGKSQHSRPTVDDIEWGQTITQEQLLASNTDNDRKGEPEGAHAMLDVDDEGINNKGISASDDTSDLLMSSSFDTTTTTSATINNNANLIQETTVTEESIENKLHPTQENDIQQRQQGTPDLNNLPKLATESIVSQINDGHQNQQQQSSAQIPTNSPKLTSESDLSVISDSPLNQHKLNREQYKASEKLNSSQQKVLGSSSDSDIALHESGTELSEDETEAIFYQNNEQPTTVTRTQVEEFTTGDGNEVVKTTITTTEIVPTKHDEGQDLQDVSNQIGTLAAGAVASGVALAAGVASSAAGAASSVAGAASSAATDAIETATTSLDESMSQCLKSFGAPDIVQEKPIRQIVDQFLQEERKHL